MNIEQKQRDNQGKQPSNTPRSVEIEAKLDQAVAYHQAGQLQQAEQICQQILDINPQNADVLNLFGLIACQIGKYEIAGDLINYALEIDPNQPLSPISPACAEQHQDYCRFQHYQVESQGLDNKHQ